VIFSKDKKGYLLIEALFAVIILSVGISVIIKSMTMSLKALNYSSLYMDALILADNKMFEYLRTGFIEAGINEKRQLPYPNAKYKYFLNSSIFENSLLRQENDTMENNINTVELQLRWDSKGKVKNLTLMTYLFNLDDK